MPADVQDTLITILSEKTLPIPELGEEVQARKGFNVIATANDRDRGVNELSCALRRRFNTVVLPVPADAEEEVDIVTRRVDAARPVAGAARGAGRGRRDPPGGHRLPRAARRASPRTAGPSSSRPSRHAVHGRGDLGGHQRPRAGRPLRRRRAARRPTSPPASSARSSRTRSSDAVVWQEYLETVVRERDGWQDFYRAARDAGVRRTAEPPVAASGVRHHGPGLGPGGAGGRWRRTGRTSC